MSDFGARGRGFKAYLHRVVSLSKTLYSPKVLVIPRKRWLHPDMTEKLLTGTLNLNTNKTFCIMLIIFIVGERTGLMVRASDSESGDPGSILGRVGVLLLEQETFTPQKYW